MWLHCVVFCLFVFKFYFSRDAAQSTERVGATEGTPQWLRVGSQEPLFLAFYSINLCFRKKPTMMTVTVDNNTSCLLSTAVCWAEGFFSVLFLSILKQPL